MGGVIAAVLAAALRAAALPAGAAVWTQTTQSDFSAGTVNNSFVTAAGGGAVRLAASTDAWSVLTPLDSRDWHGVHMLPGGSAWAVGQTRLDARGSYNVARYDGSAWAAVTTMSGGYDLYGVSMDADGNGWVAGAFGRLMASDAGEWVEEVEYSSHSADMILYGAHIFDSSSLGWAVGKGGEIVNFDGGGWGTVPAPTGQDLHAVRAVSESDVWAVGRQGTILRYDGSSWAAVSSPISSDLWSVSMVSAADGWAVGDVGTILRWDGASWSVNSSAGIALRSVWLASSSEGWAVGQTGRLLRYDGAAWSEAASPTSETLTGVSCARPERCLAVGNAGTFLKYQRDYVAVATFTTTAADGGVSPDWGTLSWTASGLGAGQTLKFQAAAASDDADDVIDFRGPDGGTGTFYTVSGAALWSGLDGLRYLKVRAFLATDDAVKTPLLESVSVSY